MKPKPTTMLWELISRLANATLTIRISGEPGTGKKSVARLLGSHYPHKNSVFLEFNCNALKMQSKGPSERARSGGSLENFLNILESPRYHVIYLEDIDHLPADLQKRLISLFDQDHRPAAPWIISSSAEPLEQSIQASGFSHRLLKALDTIHIALPPLRKQPDRIRQMFAWLLSRNEDPGGNGAGRFVPNAETMERLARYHWPGNWRQLQRVTQAYLDTKSLDFDLDSYRLEKNGSENQIDDLASIYILSLAELNIQKERVLEGLMSSSNMDEIGLLDLTIFHESVRQIADHFNVSKSKPENK